MHPCVLADERGEGREGVERRVGVRRGLDVHLVRGEHGHLHGVEVRLASQHRPQAGRGAQRAEPLERRGHVEAVAVGRGSVREIDEPHEVGDLAQEELEVAALHPVEDVG